MQIMSQSIHSVDIEFSDNNILSNLFGANDVNIQTLEKINNHNAIKVLLSIPHIMEIINLSPQIKFITFFAEWCPNCEYEAIELKKYYDSHHLCIDFSMIMLFSSKEKSKRFINNCQLNMNDYYGDIKVIEDLTDFVKTYS